MTKDYSQYVTHLVYSPRSRLFELSLSNDSHFVGEKAKSLIEWLWLDKGEPQAFRPIEIARVARSDRKLRFKTAYTDKMPEEQTFEFKGKVDGKEVSVRLTETSVKELLEDNPKVDDLRKVKAKIKKIEDLLEE